MPQRRDQGLNAMDDFQQAAAAAQRRYTELAWTALPQREQAEAIYTELRRIDTERTAAAPAASKQRPAGRATTATAAETRMPALMV
jgi:hypothetical protein